MSYSLNGFYFLFLIMKQSIFLHLSIKHQRECFILCSIVSCYQIKRERILNQLLNITLRKGFFQLFNATIFSDNSVFCFLFLICMLQLLVSQYRNERNIFYFLRNVEISQKNSSASLAMYFLPQMSFPQRFILRMTRADQSDSLTI